MVRICHTVMTKANELVDSIYFAEPWKMIPKVICVVAESAEYFITVRRFAYTGKFC